MGTAKRDDGWDDPGPPAGLRRQESVGATADTPCPPRARTPPGPRRDTRSRRCISARPRLLLPRPPALRGGVCRRRPITRSMQIGGGASDEVLPDVLVRELLDQPYVLLFSPRPTFFLRPSEIILFTYCLSWLILRARVCLLSTAVLTAGNGVTYGYIP